ncbi:MAG: chromate transporter [Muribaculaceae bacterium]
MGIYIKIIWAYLKIGLFGFGGGYAMLSLIQREIVDSGWITSQLFTDIVAISQMTPGPIGINSATYIGYALTDSIFGSVLATATVVAPPFVLILYTGHFIRRHKDSPIIKSIFKGLRPVVVGLIASAALLLMNAENFGNDTDMLLRTVPICIGSFLIVYFTKIHPIFVIVLSAFVGLLIF